MDNRDKLTVEENEWRKLCRLIANEPDSQRLSELVFELIKVLDARKQALNEDEKGANDVSKTAPGNV